MSLGLSPSRLAHLRQRTIWTLVAGVAIGSTGHIAAVTVGTIVAGSSLHGCARRSACCLGRARLGNGLGTPVDPHGPPWTARGSVARLHDQRWRNVATGAVITGSLPTLVLGTLLIGFGNSSNQLSRYAAADLVPPGRRASTLGLVVWGATVGAVVGPNLVAFSGEVAVNLGLPVLTGPYLVPMVFVGAAAVLSFVMLRPDHTSSPTPRSSRCAATTDRHLALRSSFDARPSSRPSRRWSSARW